MSTRDSERILVLVLVALTAIVLFAPRTAPRSAQVNPSGPGTTATTSPGLSGAPVRSVAPSLGAWGTFGTLLGGSSEPVGGNATSTPSPTAVTVPVATGTNPDLTPPPLPTSPHTNSNGIAGLASWYDDGPGIYVALPGGDFRGHLAVICGGSPWNCITASVRTSCICTGPPRKVADLSPDLFRQFAPLWRGIVKVTVEVLP